MKNIIIALILLLMISSTYGQNKNNAKISSVKAKENVYVKTDNPSFKYIEYKSESKNRNKILENGACDNRGIIQIPKNKGINNLVKSVLGEDLLKTYIIDGVLILSMKFTAEGRVADIGFLVPRSIDIKPQQLELIEEKMKKNLIVEVLQLNKDKKYICYGIRIPFSGVLNNTFSY